MSKTSLAAIVRYCDRLLRTAKVQDYERAANGLQVENRGNVTRVAAAVDASLATARLAAAARADLLLVHHGLFWGPTHPWTGKRYDLIRFLFEHNLAVYSSHLPLDAHPRLGNNAQLCAALGLKKLRPFFFNHGQFIGFQTQTKTSRAELARRLQRATGSKPLLIPIPFSSLTTRATVEAATAFQRQRQATLQVFFPDHKWVVYPSFSRIL